jgi:rhomboid protease GluP
MLFLIALLLIGTYIVFHVMNNAERAKLFRTGLGLALQAKDVAAQQLLEADPFRDALRERTARPLVTYLLVALNLLVFVFMLVGAGAFSSPDTLIAWGGSVGPRTTNGEWWRLGASMFVHRGLLSLLVNVGALVSLGYVLERLVGHLSFAVVYAAAGLFGSLVSLATYPMAVAVGPSAGIFGLYGLLIAAAIWGLVHRSPFTIPLRALKTLGPPAAIFVLASLGSDALPGEAELVGFMAGFGCGLFLTKDVSEQKPDAVRAAVPFAAAAMTAVAFAMPLRGVADARPEIKHVIEIEERTASSYQSAVDKFTKGWITAEELVSVIDRTIMPELQAAQVRLKALQGVPQEQHALVARADEYLRLRDASWRLRAQALHKSNMRGLREADQTERQSLEAFDKIQQPFNK